jgi:peptidoglycan biosynthesis protein MviN/MurJ (putative lipid II flippase)
MLEHGVFHHHSALITTRVLRTYAWAIVPQAVVAIATRYFLALDKTWLSAGICLFGAGVSMLFDVLLVPVYGVASFGIGSTAGALIASLGLWIAVQGVRSGPNHDDPARLETHIAERPNSPR